MDYPTVTPSTISSAALEILNQPSVNLDVDQNASARKCLAIYPTTVRQLQANHPWNFLRTRIVLAPDSTPPAFGWEFSFTLPADFLNIVAVTDSRGIQIPYQIEGTKLLAHAGAVYLIYTRFDDNEGDWTQEFIAVMTQAMVYRLAYTVTGSEGRGTTEYQILNSMLQNAKANNGKNNMIKRFGVPTTFLAGF
jgi:hypothetical protein